MFAQNAIGMNLQPAALLAEYLHLMQFDMHKAMMHVKLKKYSPQFSGQWLDIGAGDQPYRSYFKIAAEYQTTNTKRHYSQKEYERLNKLTTYWIEDGTSLPVTTGSLDGVACFQVLAVLEKPFEFFREVNRVLKPGGRLLFTSDFLYPVWSAEDRYRHSAFNLRQMAEANGFEVKNIDSFGGFGASAYAQFMRFMRSFPEIWKRKKTGAKLISAFFYGIFLALLPFFSLAGMIIFLLEAKNSSNTDFTFNLLLSAVKIEAFN